MGSGLVLNEDVRWVTYRGTNSLEVPEETKSEPPCAALAGLYDLGHLLRMLRGKERIPDEAHLAPLSAPFRPFSGPKGARKGPFLAF